MAKFVYSYSGKPGDVCDAKGKTVVSSTASQKDLEYLYSINYDGVTRKEDEPKKKGE